MTHQPCPFCGGEPECESGITLRLERRYFAQVFCRGCNALAGDARGETNEDAVRLAWERWDRRVANG